MTTAFSSFIKARSSRRGYSLCLVLIVAGISAEPLKSTPTAHMSESKYSTRVMSTTRQRQRQMEQNSILGTSNGLVVEEAANENGR